jgi:hypothetical protein
MSETNVTLAIMSQGWQSYQNRLSEPLAPLSLDQLALSAAPNLRSIDELARHIIAVRADWYHDVLNVGGEDFAAFSQWDLTLSTSQRYQPDPYQYHHHRHNRHHSDTFPREYHPKTHRYYRINIGVAGSKCGAYSTQDIAISRESYQ